MKTRLTTAVMVATFVGAVGTARVASAACAAGNLADTDDPICKNALACQKTILDAVGAYVNKIQTAAKNAVFASMKGTNTKTTPYACQGGPKNGAVCFANNGLCKDGPLMGLPCSDDSDCPGSTKCDRAKGCNLIPKKCNGLPNDGLPCTSNLDCTPGTCDSQNDAIECQPDSKHTAIAKAYNAEQAKLRAKILAKCQKPGAVVDIEDLGFETSTACPGVATALVQGQLAAYEALITCMFAASDGDINGGKIVDTILRPIGKAIGNTKPQAKRAGATQAADPLPRGMVEIPGSTFLQVGVKQTDTGIGRGGGAIPLSFAHCMGGNGAPTCLNNADCNGGTCVRDTCTVCVGGSRAGKACVAAADCLGGGTCTGACPANTYQFKTYGDATRGANSDDGNILTVASSCATSALPVCLYTRTKNSGNGTAAMGLMNFTTGEYTNRGPVETIVLIGSVCPICGAGVGGNTCGIGQVKQGSCTGTPGSDAGPNINLKCNNIGDVDGACPPTVNGAEPKIPNAFELSTAPRTISDADGVGPGTTGPGSKKLCGFCDTVGTVGCQGPASLCARGCQKATDCPPPGTVCDYTSTPLGYHGDPSVGLVTTSGDQSVYAPVYASLVCTGITGNPAVDVPVGLPAPARSINPFINFFIFSND